MLSKIGSFINPTLSKGDTVEKPDYQQEREKKDHKKNGAPAEDSHDDMYFSLEAIRALLEQENVTLENDVISSLGLLQQHGISSIPIRNEQPILEAIIEAAARLNAR